MKTSKFKEQLILDISKSIETTTIDLQKDKADLLMLKELELKTKVLFGKIKKIVNKSKIKNNVQLSFYDFSEPTRNIYYKQHDMSYLKGFKSNMKRILKAIKTTNDRNELNILSQVYKGNYSKPDYCYIKLSCLKNIPILFDSKFNSAYISINGFDIQIREYAIYEHVLSDLDKYAIEIFAKLPYEIQVNYLTEVLKISPNQDMKYFKKELPKNAKIHEFLNKLAIFS